MNARPPRKFFTVAEANAMLPLVRAIAQDLARLFKHVVERRERMSGMRQDDGRQDQFSEELAAEEAELERDCQQLSEYVEELRTLGVEPKNSLEGLIDFPAIIDNREVYLCWRLGEPKVQFWHDIEAGFAGRQPVSAPTQ